MSLILDALNRADRERKNSQPTPDINTVHEVSYRAGGTSLPKAWLIGGAVLVAVVILLVYLLLQARQQAPEVTPSAPVAREVARATSPSTGHRRETIRGGPLPVCRTQCTSGG